MRTMLRGKVTLLFMLLGMLLAVPTIALADDLRNDLDNSFEADFEVLSLQAGGASDDVNIVLQTQGGDGDAGCNLDGSEKIEVQAISSSSAASVKWADTGTDKVEFLGCNAPSSRNLTVTPGSSAGSANVTFKITSTGATETSPGSGIFTVPSTGGGTYDMNTARFTVNVTPPPNTPPTVSVTGVTHGATYDKGTVPDAGCSVTDTEDGLNASTTAATPQVDSTNLDSDGLGLETVTCSYTDGGGLTVTASATYTIVDPSAPVIGHTLNPATPDGNNGWYKSNVSLTWNVTENESPNSLQKTGCVDQNITADQQETTYSCSATSSGGSAGLVNVSIKRDGTDPDIADVGTTQTPNGDGWFNTAVTNNFSASDATSGLPASFTTPFSVSSGNAEGSAVKINSGPVSDIAGNTNPGIDSAAFKIDKTKPTVSVTGVSNGATYTTGNVPTPGCDTTDGLSGVKTNATVNVTGGTGGFGTLTATCSGAVDNADNNQAAPVSVTYSVKAGFNGFLQPIDGHAVNTGKYGRTYPIKWQLRDSSGALISDSAAQLLVATMTGGQKAVTCDNFALLDSDTLEESTTGNTSLRYDATSDQFIYNYKAPTSGSCYVFAIRNADGLTTQQIDFKFTK